MTYHKSLETIPLYNYYKLTEKNDFRYLIVNVDVNCLPVSVKENELKLAFLHFNTSHTEVDLSIQVAFFNALNSYYNFINLSGTQQKAHDAFLKYCRVLDRTFKSYKYDNKVFDKAHELRNYLYSKFDFNKAFENCYEILDYNKIVAETKYKWDLYGDILFIKTILDYQIDEFRTTAKMFFYLKNKAIEKYNKQKEKS